MTQTSIERRENGLSDSRRLAKRRGKEEEEKRERGREEVDSEELQAKDESNLTWVGKWKNECMGKRKKEQNEQNP